MKQTTIGPGSKVVYEWTEGAFGGNAYEIDLLADGTIKWLCIQGSEKGKSAIENTYSVREVTSGVTQIAWLEAVGYTVNVTVVPAEGRAIGIVSNDKEFYVLAGKLREVR